MQSFYIITRNFLCLSYLSPIVSFTVISLFRFFKCTNFLKSTFHFYAVKFPFFLSNPGPPCLSPLSVILPQVSVVYPFNPVLLLLGHNVMSCHIASKFLFPLFIILYYFLMYIFGNNIITHVFKH